MTDDTPTPTTVETLPCKEWEGRIDKWGYGRLYFRKRDFLAHRWAWIQANGDIPDGFMVLHLCDNSRCYEASHLYLGTQEDNMRDLVARNRAKFRVTHCPQGHPYDEANTRLTPPGADGRGRRRECRACGREAAKRYRARRTA